MISLLPLLALVPQRRYVAPTSSPWVAKVLRDAPPSPPSVYVVPDTGRQPDGSVLLKPGEVLLDYEHMPMGSPDTIDDFTLMNRRTAKLIERGEYEKAYGVQEAGHPAHEMDFADLYADAALLTGRYADAQGLLVRYLRREPGSMGRYELALSAAVSLRGQAYPGQGASVLEALRGRLALYPEEARLLPDTAPTTPEGVAFLSVLALGVWQHEPAYLEWALRLDPSCELAGRELVVMYHARPGHGPDASRVAAAMLRGLPAGPRRADFAKYLKAWDVRPAAATAAKPKSP